MAELNGSQIARIEKADRFLRTAQQALQGQDYESCISRAYYAVFHSMCTLVLDESDAPQRISREVIIQELIRWNATSPRLRFAGTLDNRHVNLRQSLAGLFRWRNEADYEYGTATLERARRSVQFAERLLQTTKEILI